VSSSRSDALGGLRGSTARLDGTIASDPFSPGHALTFRLDMTLRDDCGADAGRLRLVGLRLPARSWRALAGVELRFADDDETYDGEPARSAGIGELVAGERNLAATASRLRFERDADDSDALVAHLDVAVGPRPAQAGAQPAGAPVELELAAPVEPGAVTVALTGSAGADEARAIAGELLDLDDYEAADVDGRLVLTPRSARARA
jgi:hypothetical protein